MGIEFDVRCCVTYSCGGDDLFSDDPQRVHYGDVAQPPRNTQSSVTILNKKAQSVTCVCLCTEVCVCVNVSVHVPQ